MCEWIWRFFVTLLMIHIIREWGNVIIWIIFNYSIANGSNKIHQPTSTSKIYNQKKKPHLAPIRWNERLPERKRSQQLQNTILCWIFYYYLVELSEWIEHMIMRLVVMVICCEYFYLVIWLNFFFCLGSATVHSIDIMEFVVVFPIFAAWSIILNKLLHIKWHAIPKFLPQIMCNELRVLRYIHLFFKLFLSICLVVCGYVCVRVGETSWYKLNGCVTDTLHCLFVIYKLLNKLRVI